MLQPLNSLLVLLFLLLIRANVEVWLLYYAVEEAGGQGVDVDLDEWVLLDPVHYGLPFYLRVHRDPQVATVGLA